MSIVELILAGSLDSLLGAILWLLVGQRCPLLVVAGPSDAGKSTTMEALLAFLPAAEVIVPVQGMYDNFAFLRNSDPGMTCLVCAEIGYGMPWYLWGRKAAMYFECAKLGYSLGTTLHADSAEEATSILRDYLQVPSAVIGRLGFIVSLGVRLRSRRIERWISAVDVIELTPEGEGESEARGETEATGELVAVPLYRRRTPDATAHNFFGEQMTDRAIARKVGLPPTALAREVERRRLYLTELIAQGVTDYAQVRERLVAFRE